MKNIIPYEKDIKFDTKISEITSISLEHEENIDNNIIVGKFIVYGDYKSHQISVNTDDFKYSIPFEIELSDNIDKNSIELDINDFTYDLKNDDILTVKIELSFSYSELEKEDINENIEEIDNIVNENRIEEAKIIEEDKLNNEIEELLDDKEERPNNIIQNNSNKDNTYITYHVYLINKDDTIENICQKYNVTKEILHEYNEFDEIKVGNKLLIPIEIDEQ